MAAFPTNVIMPPPLPPGWSEHTAPGGQIYFFNAQTNQSTYIRPLPTFPLPAHMLPPQLQAQLQPPASTITGEDKKTKKKKKEKPLVKTPIPGTDWIRVKTTSGNFFYTHQEKKESFWEVPEEIADAVKEIEAKELEEAAENAIRDVEERVKGVEAGVNAPPQPPATAPDVEPGKRKAEAEGGRRKGKKAKVESPPGPVPEDEEEPDEDEEAWQREMAEQMAAETEGGAKSLAAEMQVDSAKVEKDKQELPKDFNMPNQVNLSTDEAKALFKTLLQEKDISPLTPYDSALPLLIQDPRYVLLPSITDRHAAFNEYCLEKSRALRAAKAASSGQSSAATSKPGDEKQKAREAFDALLNAELTSTRTSWDEFRRRWKKDRRFFGFGRDDREREKVFREFRASLGERKRQEAQKAEVNFFALLNERAAAEGLLAPGITWKDVKKHRSIYSDPRYNAVGSSSLREELFSTFLKSKAKPNDPSSLPSASGPTVSEPSVDDSAARDKAKKERTEKALLERGEQARKEKAKVDRDIGRSRGNLSEERGVEEFMTLLTDAIRDPLVTFQESTSLLARSPVFASSPLPRAQQIALFNAHVAKLRKRQLAALHTLFEGYTPGLDAKFGDLPESVFTSAPATKLGLAPQALSEEMEEGEDRSHRPNDDRPNRAEMRHLWEEWQDERTKRARADFDKLLEENSFVGFWAGLGKMDQDKQKEKGTMGEVVPGLEDLDDSPAGGEDDAAGGKTDLKTLAKGIGLKEIEKVLQHDKRYQVFAHVPEERQRWVGEHVAKLSAPKLSVHVTNDR